jgi:hypothetical protein
MTRNGCSTLARTLDFVRFFAALHFIHDAAMAVALVGEVLSVWRVITDHVFLSPIGLIAVHPRLVAVQQLSQHRRVVLTGDVSGGTHLRPDTGTGTLRRLSDEGGGLRQADRRHPEAAEADRRTAREQASSRQATGTPAERAGLRRRALHAILGVDMTLIDGLGPSLALKLVGE